MNQSDGYMADFAAIVARHQRAACTRHLDGCYEGFGNVCRAAKSFVGDVYEAETEFTNEVGEVIGYWAYGYFDPALPFNEEAKLSDG